MRDRLLSGPRAIARDLIDKKLLPVALLLLVALVAVPFVLGGGGDAPVAPAALPATPAQPGSDSAISVSAPAILGRSRPGPVHDPFYNPPAPKSQSTGATTTATSSNATASTSGDSTTTTSPAGSGGVTAPSTSVAPSTPSTTQTVTVYRARVRWGADDTADVRGLSRLQPLGGLTNPALLYLGTNVDGKRAAFLLGPNAIADGQAECAEKTCRVIALKAGESTKVGVIGEDGSVTRAYTLVIDKIAADEVSPATARLRRARVHADGRDVLRELIKDRKTAAAIGQFTYDADYGAVVSIAAP